MPRPDIAAIGSSYRRIPILSIGRDIYTDSRLILQKLEELYPRSPTHPSISSPNPSSFAIQKLLEIWVVDGGVFARSAQSIPSSAPMVQDKRFVEDRQQMGFAMSKEVVEERRPEAVVEVRNAFDFLERGLLADGREWILKSEKPTLADIEGVWTFIWVKSIPGALSSNHVSTSHFPKTFAWMSRFEKYAKSNLVKPLQTLKGSEAVRQIENSRFAEQEGSVDEKDPSGLRKGQEVEVWPVDTGFRNKEKGPLVSLTPDEIVIEGKTQNGKDVRIHAPRHGFRIARVNASKM